MEVTRTIHAARQFRSRLGKLALVPTMGALHSGHASLFRRAAQLADHVAVSIFVNPTQFGPNEDFSRYPRPIERDLEICRSEGVDLVFNPEPSEMYPPGELPLIVDVPSLTTILEGRQRPGHFVGVCRVVAKLFGVLQPQVACFGAKDYQQLKVIQAMTTGLCLPVDIEPCPIIREPDGLAMSSRNVYLNAEDREHALALSKALAEARRLITGGIIEPRTIEHAMEQVLRAHKALVDYAVVRHPRTLAELDMINLAAEPVVCLIAARIGNVRLIDNALVSGQSDPVVC